MASKRELIEPNGDKRYVRRDAKGRIRESDDQGRSLAQDQRRKAKTVAKAGQGDRGDRATTAKATGRKAATAKKAATKQSARKSVTKTASKSTTKRPATKPATKRAASRRAPAASRGPNAIQLLKDDHVLVRKLLGELEKTTSRGAKSRVELLARIGRELEVHTTIEEEIFYPAFKAAAKKADDQKLYFEALEEHRAAGDLVLPDLLATDPASDCFGGRTKVLKELVEHHAREEEKDMFPRARALLSPDELKVLGERMRERKAVLMATGPAAPPKSAAVRLVEAVTGVITGGKGDGTGGSSEGAART
jgi:hemerythrin superfamily protein